MKKKLISYPKDLHARLVLLAKAEHRTLNSQIVHMLSNPFYRKAK